MHVVRLTKDDQTKWVTSHVFDKKVDFFKSEGWQIDPRPYVRELDAKGAKYVLDVESWKKEEEMRERADKDAEKPKATRRRKKKAEEPAPEEPQEPQE